MMIVTPLSQVFLKKSLYSAFEMGEFMICKVYLTKIVLREREPEILRMWQED